MNMENSKKRILLTGVITLLPMAAGILLWNRLPSQMATSWSMDGTATGWSSKVFVVFVIPLLLFGLHLFCVVYTFNDPKRKNIGGKMFRIILWITPAAAVLTMVCIYGVALGLSLNVATITNILAGVVFIAIGNYMPKCRQNYTVGIKLPWTLNSEENWNRTHRLGGWITLAVGVLFFLNVFLQSDVLPAVAVALVLVPGVYSFVLYKRGI